MRRIAVFFLAGLVVWAGCSDNPANSHKAKMIYYTSFERAVDTTGWEGFGTSNFVFDPAPLCGRRALRLSGGCLQPTASLVLGPFEVDGKYTFSLWARSLKEVGLSGGMVFLLRQGTFPQLDSSVSVAITEDKWRDLNAPATVFCPAGQRLQLEFFVGGIVPAAVLVDGLAVYCVKE